MSQLKNPLIDKEFLKELDLKRDKEIFVKIIALTFQEHPIEQIEGVATGGSINIDGASAVRRTCNLTMVANDVEINDFYWGLKNKFKLEIGLRNNVDTENYPDIIWFPQGTYVITGFNTTHNVNSHTISISGKDKMCLLNGDLGGNLPASIDFGTEEYYDRTTNTITYTQIPIKKIITEALHAYAMEPYHNIIINDLDDAAVELLEYKGDSPLYLLYDPKEDQYKNYTDNGNTLIRFAIDEDIENNYFSVKDLSNTTKLYSAKEEVIEFKEKYEVIKDIVENQTMAIQNIFKEVFINPDGYQDDLSIPITSDNVVEKVYDENRSIYRIKKGRFNQRVNLAIDTDLGEPTQVYFKNGGDNIYEISKIEYGQTVGYRYTDITYAGELISSIGESLTSILDKIKNMLGNFEYFYDLEGRFIFQKKKTYTYTSWNSISNIGDDEYAENAAHTSSLTYMFEGNKLITAFQNTPNLANLRNDYSVWGQRKGITGELLPIHYRYAIDKKPERYTALREIEVEGKENPITFVTSGYAYKMNDEHEMEVDWRELIYQMALDYYQFNEDDNYGPRLAAANVGRENNKEEQDLYQTGTTGYEQYYIDMQGFWRQLYNPRLEPEYSIVNYEVENSYDEIFKEGNQLCVLGKYEKYDSEKNKDIPHSEVYALKTYSYEKDGETKYRKELLSWIDAIDLSKEYAEILNEEDEIVSPNLEVWEEVKDNTGKVVDYASTKLYIQTALNEYKPLYWSVRKQYARDELLVKNGEDYLYLTEYYNYLDDNDKNLKLYYYTNKDKFYNIVSTYGEDEIIGIYINKRDKENSDIYFNRYLYKSPLDYKGDLIKEGTPVKYLINYFEESYSYIEDENSKDKYWSTDIIEAPAALNFWFDFLDSESELGQFSIPVVGDRAKAVNDNQVTAIYFRQVPDLIFTTFNDYNEYWFKDRTGYTPVFINRNLEGMFSISAQGKSAQDKLDELLYDFSYCIENVTITTIPVYYLQPNTRIFVRNEESAVNGEYIINKITIPLQYNGTMSITANKAPERIY